MSQAGCNPVSFGAWRCKSVLRYSTKRPVLFNKERLFNCEFNTEGPAEWLATGLENRGEVTLEGSIP